MRPHILHSRRREFIPPQPSRLGYVDHLEKRGVDLGRLETELIEGIAAKWKDGLCCNLIKRATKNRLWNDPVHTGLAVRPQKSMQRAGILTPNP